jgi:hypothetical protein
MTWEPKNKLDDDDVDVSDDDDKDVFGDDKTGEINKTTHEIRTKILFISKQSG